MSIATQIARLRAQLAMANARLTAIEVWNNTTDEANWHSRLDELLRLPLPQYTQAEIDDGKAKATEWAPMFDEPTDTAEQREDELARMLAAETIRRVRAELALADLIVITRAQPWHSTHAINTVLGDWESEATHG